MLAGDDATRSRSLHVLSGGGGALVLLVVLTQVGAAEPTADAARLAIDAIRTIGVFVVAAVGWLVATEMRPPGRPRRPGDDPAVAGAQ